MFCIKLIDREGHTICNGKGEEEVNLPVTHEYEEGDQIELEISGAPVYAWLQLDDALGKSLVYLTGNYSYPIPFGKERTNLAPKTFSGNKHLLSIRKARSFEIDTYRNVALNVNDNHRNTTCFPHASANVETRGEAVFAAKNAIDGVTANSSHGEWPYASWGINRNPDAVMKLDFGRNITTDRIVLYLRADFPHDSWWTNATVTFSDGETMKLDLKKTAGGQEFTFPEKTITWLELSRLIKAEDPSPFPALTQIEVYGR